MPQPKHILVCEADLAWRGRMLESLRAPHYALSAVENGLEALAVARREKPSMLVTELMLPGLSGLGLTRLLREEPALESIGILMVTAHVSEIDRVLAFEAGVDDLLAKPFFGRELASRVNAVLRRTEGTGSPRSAPLAMAQGMVRLDASNGFVLVNERRVDLTPRELQLLASLMRQAGRVVSRRRLIASVWGEGSEQTERVVDAHVKAIRRKLGEAKGCLETVRGVGYRFTDLVRLRA